jgi:hypothetical protein
LPCAACSNLLKSIPLFFRSPQWPRIKPSACRSETCIDFAQNLEVVVARKEKVRSAKAVHVKEALNINSKTNFQDSKTF